MEIGSEFWLEREVQPMKERDGVYTLSGRTAIDVILQDILLKRSVKNVYMPAYCCDSMIAPFAARGIEVELYDVGFDGQLRYDIDTAKETDIFYINNYFGYENGVGKEVIARFKRQGSVILYDRTHSFLMENDDMECDYSFASIRKWMGVVCGAVVKGVGAVPLKRYDHLDCKELAMRKKTAFIGGDKSIDKQEFLNLYAEFGHHLTADYRNYAMDDLSFAIYHSEDFSAMRTRRRANARYLHEHLNLQFLGDLTKNACPLFVPVLFDTKEHRDAVRKKLIDAQIYCPIHWPKNSLLGISMKANEIIDRELSLICDQRYGLEEMEHLINEINQFI